MLRGAFRLFKTPAKVESPFTSLWGGTFHKNVTSNIDSRIPFITYRNPLAPTFYPVLHPKCTLPLRQLFGDATHVPTPSSAFGNPSTFSAPFSNAARKSSLPQGSRAEPQLTSNLTKALRAAARRSPPVSRVPRGSQAIERGARRFYNSEPTRKAKGTKEMDGNSFVYVASKKESWWSGIRRHLSVLGSRIASIGHVPLVPLLLGLGGAVPFIALSTPVSPHVPLPDGLKGRESEAQAAYSACILSFLGGPHWGLAMAGYHTVPGAGLATFRLQSLRYLWSVSPSLLAWPSLLLPPGPQQAVLMGSFALALGIDAAFTSARLLPKWYLPMRVLLTGVAITSLGATWAFSFLSASETVSESNPILDPSEQPE